MRFFIALEIPEQNRQEIEVIQEHLKKIIPQARFTDPQKFHMTIAFLGEQPEDLRQPIIEALKNAASGMGPFQITPAYLDGFPSLHRAHILWLGVKGDMDKLFLIREKVKDGLYRLNLRLDERRFVPHIALAKMTGFKLAPGQEEDFQKIMSLPFDPVIVSSIKLFESVADEGFHKHNTLAEIHLGQV